MNKKITGIILGGIFIVTSNAWAVTPQAGVAGVDPAAETALPKIEDVSTKVDTLGAAFKAKSLALSGKTKVSGLTPSSLISNGIYNQDTIQKVNALVREMNKASLKSYSKSLTTNSEGLKLKGILEKAIEKRKASQETSYDVAYRGCTVRVYFDANGNPLRAENLNLAEDDSERTRTWDQIDVSTQNILLNQVDPEKYPIYTYIFNFATGELEEYRNNQENGTISYTVSIESDRIYFYNENGDELVSYWYYTEGADIGGTDYTKLVDARGEVIGYTDLVGTFITAKSFDEMYNKYQDEHPQLEIRINSSNIIEYYDVTHDQWTGDTLQTFYTYNKDTGLIDVSDVADTRGSIEAGRKVYDAGHLRVIVYAPNGEKIYDGAFTPSYSFDTTTGKLDVLDNGTKVGDTSCDVSLDGKELVIYYWGDPMQIIELGSSTPVEVNSRTYKLTDNNGNTIGYYDMARSKYITVTEYEGSSSETPEAPAL